MHYQNNMIMNIKSEIIKVLREPIPAHNGDIFWEDDTQLGEKIRGLLYRDNTLYMLTPDMGIVEEIKNDFENCEEVIDKSEVEDLFIELEIDDEEAKSYILIKAPFDI